MVEGKTPAVFFDRDGTIMQDVNYCSDPKDVHVFPFVAESLRRLKAAGFKLIMVTNQSGIGRFQSKSQSRGVSALRSPSRD